jgi:dTDP-4-dehydrorhamnose reductase
MFHYSTDYAYGGTNTGAYSEDDITNPQNVYGSSKLAGKRSISDDEAGEFAREQMKHLYQPFNRNHERTMYMDVRCAEFTKYAANAILARRRKVEPR